MTQFACFRRFLIPVLLFLYVGLLAAQNAGVADASVHGVVRDASGSPVPNVQLVLQKKSDPKGLSINADASGRYSVTGISAGEYSLHAAGAGYSDNGPQSLVIKPHETKTQDLVLKADSIAAPQFFDKPQFTVSGVVDTTALGGHGSDTVVRTRESIAKDAVTLGKSDAAIPGAPPGIQNLVSAGKYKEAREQVRQLVASADKPELHHLLADIDEKSGDALDAVHEYQRAAEMSPSESYLFDWGSELLLHHAAEPAEQVFANGNRLFPQSPRMLIGLGSASFALGLFDDAVRRICQASDLNPNDSAPYLFLGKMQSAENVSSPQLVDRLHRFVTIQPKSAQANYYYAVAIWKRNRAHRGSDPEVESLLASAIQLDPEFALAEFQLGVVKSEQGDNAGAIPHFIRAVQLDPQMQEGHFRLSQIYRKMGATEKAQAELRAYQDLSTKSAEQIERERREIPQFVYTLRNSPPPQTR